MSMDLALKMGVIGYCGDTGARHRLAAPMPQDTREEPRDWKGK
jgi:hypothetical protein